MTHLDLTALPVELPPRLISPPQSSFLTLCPNLMLAPLIHLPVHGVCETRVWVSVGMRCVAIYIPPPYPLNPSLPPPLSLFHALTAFHTNVMLHPLLLYHDHLAPTLCTMTT